MQELTKFHFIFIYIDNAPRLISWGVLIYIFTGVFVTPIFYCPIIYTENKEMKRIEDYKEDAR